MLHVCACTPPVFLSTPTMIGRPSVVLPLAVPASPSLSSAFFFRDVHLVNAARCHCSVVYSFSFIVSPLVCVPSSSSSQAMNTSASGRNVGQIVFFYFTSGWKVGAGNCTRFLMFFFLILVLRSPQFSSPPCPRPSPLRRSSRAAPLCPTFHVLLSFLLDSQALLHAQPSKKRLPRPFSSWRCHHHVHDKHSISFSEPQYIFRHLVLKVLP